MGEVSEHPSLLSRYFSHGRQTAGQDEMKHERQRAVLPDDGVFRGLVDESTWIVEARVTSTIRG